MRFLHISIVASVLVAAVSAQRTRAAGDDVVPFEKLALEWLADRGIGDASSETFDFDDLLDRHFVHARLGLYEVHMSAKVTTDKVHAGWFQEMGLALLGAQEVWLNWVEPITGDVKQPRKDLTTLQTWLKSARGGRIAAAAAKGGGDLYESLAARDSVVEAAERFGEFMAKAEALGVVREGKGIVEPVILVPNRLEFVRFISFAGWLRPELRETFWQPAVVEWTNFYVEHYKVIALEFAAPGASAGDFTKGVSMNSRTDDGMQQQVVQLCANSLIDNYFGDRIPPSLAGGLAVNLVIDLYGECNTRVDGDLRSRRTEAYEMFVPGGASEGGILAMRAADSRWREHQGSDYFVAVLRASQAEGANEAKKLRGKIQHFELLNDAKNKQTVVSGPYLGSPAKARPDPAPEFQGDHLEFLRAYRSCFVHWLRTKAGGTKAKSAVAFAEFLKAAASAYGGSEMIEELVATSFGGTPLSSKELSKKDLEGAFLAWLATK